MVRTQLPNARFRSAGVTALLLACTVWLPARAASADADPQPSASLDQLTRALPQEQRCELAFLQHLGWRFERDAEVKEVTIEAGWPCRYEDLAAVHAAGGLRVRLPASFDADDARVLGSRLAALATSIGSRCAYQLRVAAATRRAVKRLTDLTEKGRYAFPEILGLVEFPLFNMRLPHDTWAREGRMYVAQRSARKAMESIFERGGLVECYGGRVLAVYAVQYELYGGAAFDEAFEPHELAVGQPPYFQKTPLGQLTHNDRVYPWSALLLDPSHKPKDPILLLAPYGPAAFAGLSGSVVNQCPDTRTNENLVVVSVSKRALEELVKGGGRSWIARQAKRASDEDNLASGLFVSSKTRREADRKIDAILAAPGLSEFDVYVHPYGVLSLADLVRMKLDEADTPVHLRLNVHGLEYALFLRYREVFKKRCLAKGPAVAPG